MPFTTIEDQHLLNQRNGDTFGLLNEFVLSGKCIISKYGSLSRDTCTALLNEVDMYKYNQLVEWFTAGVVITSVLVGISIDKLTFNCLQHQQDEEN